MDEREWDPVYDEYELHANTYTFRSLRFTILIILLVWALDMIDVFVLDKLLMSGVAAASIALLAVPRVLAIFFGKAKPWMKYVLLSCISAAFTLVASTLTYHATLCLSLPMVFAAQYRQRRAFIFTYVISALGIFISTMVGYYVGICDMNTLFSSTAPISTYFDAATGEVRNLVINPDPWAILPLYAVVPRCLILLVFAFTLQSIITSNTQDAMRVAQLQLENATDQMTHLYNKGKFDEMVAKTYPRKRTIAIIYFDLNNLKTINDSYGHAQGDILINATANCIHKLCGKNGHGFRLGGDEFVLVIDEPRAGEMIQTVADAKRFINEYNKSAEHLLAIAISWASGAGNEVTSVMQRAEQVMYREKNEWHDQHDQLPRL